MTLVKGGLIKMGAMKEAVLLSILEQPQGKSMNLEKFLYRSGLIRDLFMNLSHLIPNSVLTYPTLDGYQ
jgi:hypothetical protein